MTTRYVLTAENDSTDPPDTIHLVYGAESSWRFMAQRGSRDYPVTPDGLLFLAAVLREHGYRVEPSTVDSRAVLVSRELWTQVQQDVVKLRALEAGGVDNWDGYDAAMVGVRHG